ncbi:MAG: hypothetical protein MJ168_12525 [Clostridia bacterium]|nr:hypothetical protein [Clostridia bacterium]
MIIQYKIIDPTKNITALVETPVDAVCQPDIAVKIMEQEKTVEQVGFVQNDSLRMAGGEFCGNASMSAAVLMCEKSGLGAGESRTVQLNVSGSDEPVPVDVSKNADGTYIGTVNMPAPISVETVSLRYNDDCFNLPLVKFKGVSHIISEGQLSRAQAEKAVCELCKMLGFDGLGIMLLDREKETLNPLVYVPKPETLFWESSCASGTSAVGAYISHSENRSVELTLKEPGGCLTVRADGSKIKLTGTVTILETKTIDI